jgi:hypothetical protein
MIGWRKSNIYDYEITLEAILQFFLFADITSKEISIDESNISYPN